MATETAPTVATVTVTADSRRDLVGWDPQDPARWDSRTAWTTLWVTTINLLLAFVIWYLPGALIPTLGTLTGWDLSESQSYWLLAMPGLTGGALRLVWMTLPPLMGTRKMLTLSALLMLIPFAGWTWVVMLPEQPSYALLVALALAAGLGGGVFSGYMPSTSYFFPKRMQGTALGLQAGLGNFGVSVVQFVVPWAIGFGLFGIAGQVSVADDGTTKDVWLQNPGLIFIPFAVVGLVLAWTLLTSVPVKANLRQQFDIFSNKHTWIMTLQYVMTFGMFSGLAGTFGMLLKTQFGPGYLKFVFLGALVGSLARICWGPLCDRFGGAVWTVVSGIGMAASAGVVLYGQVVAGDEPSLGIFMTGMVLIFFFAGIGNASTFKQMPMIFPARQAGGVIGWTAAIAAFGPFLFSMAFNYLPRTAVFAGVLVYALLCAALAWYYYARPGAEARS
ncbi:nitrate/nitrite transporter [Cellulomonas hominis]|uniref:Nitrate/nitrite transporter n=1 Tax=Cellulomonas hominis TaxID=156981 RepID=A0A511FHX8_9CELL|nr:MFS transporter [Cellulomonas hominis]MBB5472737.1 NNP family nitrate/nitrite transporter-like MFS transporter [Cellulomonas hominis]NKY05920.1 NarK/NasA family nitrate transporter [Cellulomonas hominis]NKY09545.1 NarK/NasA family nitrate transporter [Cellulomonas hominis]GEL47957.1 nitrate/nitrite transporter [Cellulomonas hominis]